MRLGNVIACALVCCAVSSTAWGADGVVGRIQSIHPWLPGNLVYVHLKGYPSLNGGACPNVWYVGNMSDPNFKSFIYGPLLAAKVADADIKIYVDGCSATYPVIVGVEYSPRQ